MNKGLPAAAHVTADGLANPAVMKMVTLREFDAQRGVMVAAWCGQLRHFR